MPLVLKDVRLALAEAENAGAPMPSVNVVRDRLITGIARGYADLDWTALGLIAAEEAGLNVPSRRSQLKIDLRRLPIAAAQSLTEGRKIMTRQTETLEINMERVDIPGTSLKVSPIALGTWAIGGWMWGGTDEAEAIRTIHEAVDHGITLIDTAPAYGFGRSEEIVGKALAEGGRRKRVADRNQGRPRLEGRTTVPQWQQDAHPQRDRGFAAASAHRCHRHLSGALARPQRADRGNRGSDGGSAARRQDSGDRRQQLQPRADRCLPQGRACAYGAAAVQSVRARHRSTRSPLLPGEQHCHTCLRPVVPGSALWPHDGADAVCRGRPAKERPQVPSSSVCAIPAGS